MNHRDPCGERIGGLAKRRNGTTATSKFRGAVARYGGMMRKLSSSYSVPQGGCKAGAKSWGRQPDTGPLVGAAHEHVYKHKPWSARKPGGDNTSRRLLPQVA